MSRQGGHREGNTVIQGQGNEKEAVSAKMGDTTLNRWMTMGECVIECYSPAYTMVMIMWKMV